MMVNDANDFSIVNAIDNLFLFIVVDEDNFLFFYVAYTSGTDETYILAVIDNDILMTIIRNILRFVRRLEERFRIVP